MDGLAARGHAAAYCQGLRMGVLLQSTVHAHARQYCAGTEQGVHRLILSLHLTDPPDWPRRPKTKHRLIHDLQDVDVPHVN